MNNQEAIARLQVGTHGKREKIKFNKAFYPKQDNTQLEQDIEVYEIAISAIEKQIPKPYRPDPCHGCFGAANNDCGNCENGGGSSE